MKKVFLALFLLIIYSCFTWGKIEAVEYKPLITGNYEQGHRIYESELEEGDYFFREGWVKWKKKFSTSSYYYLKLRYAENSYQRESYDSRTVDLTGNYTYQLFQPLRMKVEVQLMEKNYLENLTKDYLEVGTNLELSYRPGKKDHFLWNVSYQQENYFANDKTNGMTGLSLRWERKVFSGFSVHSRFKFTRIDYFEENASSDKERKSISVGFEYQL